MKWIFVILSTSRKIFSNWVIIIIYFTLVANTCLIYYSIMKSRKLNAYLNRGIFIDILIWLINNARKKYKKTKLQESIILSIELFRFAVDILFTTLEIHDMFMTIFLYQAELLQLNKTQYPSLGIFVYKKCLKYDKLCPPSIQLSKLI